MTLSQRLLTGFWLLAGTMHFVIPRNYEAIVPPYVPIGAKQAVRWSGVAEIAGGLLVISPRTRNPFARLWLIALLAAVFPANIYMATNPEDVRGLDLDRVPRWALWARLPLQPLAALWVWRATRA